MTSFATGNSEAMPEMATMMASKKVKPVTVERNCYTFTAIPPTARSFHIAAKGQRLTGSFEVIDGTVTTQEAEESEDIVLC